MKKLGMKDNFRVVIIPRRLGDFGGISMSDSFFYKQTPEDQKRYERDQEDRANEIAAQAKRHCDEVSRVDVEYDQAEVCEHCGYRWGEERSDYNGGCCEKDQEAEDARLIQLTENLGFPVLVKA